MSNANKPKDQALRALVLHHLITALTIAGLLALGVWGYLSYRNNEGFFYQGDQEAEKPSVLKETLIKSQKQKLALAVGAFYDATDNYPANLEELALEGWIGAADLSYPDGKTRYQMTIKEDQITITTQDAQPDTAQADAKADSADKIEEEPKAKKRKKADKK